MDCEWDCCLHSIECVTYSSMGWPRVAQNETWIAVTLHIVQSFLITTVLQVIPSCLTSALDYIVIFDRKEAFYPIVTSKCVVHMPYASMFRAHIREILSRVWLMSVVFRGVFSSHSVKLKPTYKIEVDQINKNHWNFTWRQVNIPVNESLQFVTSTPWHLFVKLGKILHEYERQSTYRHEMAQMLTDFEINSIQNKYHSSHTCVS